VVGNRVECYGTVASYIVLMLTLVYAQPLSYYLQQVEDVNTTAFIEEVESFMNTKVAQLVPLHKSVVPTLYNTFTITNVTFAFGASAVILAVLYMVGVFLEHAALQTWVKVETGELLTSVLLFLAFLAVFNTLATIPANVLFPFYPSLPEGNVYEVCVELLSNFSISTSIVFVLESAFMSLITKLFGMQVIAAPLGIGTQTESLRPVLSLVNALMQSALISTALSIVTVLGQLHVLNFAHTFIIKYLLPFAFFFRSFSPTRKFGGSLIAISFTFLFIYPFIIVLFYGALNNIGFWSFYVKEAKMSLAMLKQVFMHPIDFAERIALSTDPIAMLTQTTFASIFSALFMLFIPPTAYVFLGGVLFVVLILIIVLTFNRYLSRMFGEEVDITQLTRMI